MGHHVLSSVLAGALALGAASAQAEPARAEPARAPTLLSAPAATTTSPPPSSVEPAAAPAAVVVDGPALSPSPLDAKGKPSAPIPEPVRLSDDPRPTLGPGTFLATVNAAERYRAVAEAGGWPSVPNGVTLLKPGARGAAIATLRQRLAVSDDLPAEAAAGDLFDEALSGAVRRFQFRHGLEETGLVGPRTLVHLNVPAATRLLQLKASAARLMGSKFPFGERYLVVNIPSQAVEAVRGGAVVRRHVAVVGKPDRPSPSVETRVTSVNFNPTWTVPTSLIKKDIIPHVRKDPSYLAKMKIRIIDGSGQEVDPARIDWSTERAANYTIRQDAGLENSLGEIRLDMPNRHAVYMHDTPSKRLFARNRRLLSSGCVRVAGVKELAAWLLEGAPGPAGTTGWGSAEIDAAIAGGARLDAKLPKPVPVTWIYLTGYATADGVAHFRDDVYGLDAPEGASPKPAGRELTLEDLVTSSVGALTR